MAVEPGPGSGTVTRPDPPVVQPSPGTADGPLLANAEELRASWQRVRASFVDDPHGAVVEAAELVEHVAQALTGALAQRQRQLREHWDGDDQSLDTEELRLTMQRYHTVFSQICRP